MKKIVTSLILAILTYAAVAQNPATLTFLGIPVDGTRAEMVQALKAKGFRYNPYTGALMGKFNGVDSRIFISTNHGKVDRVYVCDANPSDKKQIRIRYNNLLQQFMDNTDKYFAIDDYTPIPDKEDIAREMRVHKKEYVATFHLSPIYGWTDEEGSRFLDKLALEISDEIGEEKVPELTLEKKTELFVLKSIESFMKMTTGLVMFCIFKDSGKYYISLCYDNLNNHPIGEDL